MDNKHPYSPSEGSSRRSLKDVLENLCRKASPPTSAQRGRQDAATPPPATEDTAGRSGNPPVKHAPKEISNAVFHLNPSPMALSSIPDRRFVDVNDAFLSITGYARDEVLGRSSRDIGLFVDPEKQAALAERILGGEPVSNIELQLRCKDGSVRDGLFSATIMTCKGSDCLLSVMLDITQHKKDEAQILFQAQVLDSVSESVVVTDFDSNILYWGPGAENLYGYTCAEVLGKPYRHFAGAIDGCDAEAFKREILDKGYWSGENVQRRRDGSTFWSAVHISVMRDADGTPIGFIGLDHDISERKQAEREKAKLQEQLLQSQKMESIGRLAGGIAHDFNNLLIIIMGAAELCIQSAPPDDVIRKDLNEIMSAGERAAVLTRQLLAFARKQVIAPKMLDINSAVAGMLSLLRRLIGEAIELSWQPGTGLWPVTFDPGQLDQLLANLCINARDAIAENGRIVIATDNAVIGESGDDGTSADAIPGDYVVLSVSDNGAGMSDETLANIFEPFYTTKNVGKGNGLGLATVYGIVRQNGGFIDVKSTPGQGSTFRIHLPRFAGQATVATPRADASARAEGKAEALLLVEDDPSVCATTQRFLEQMGYTVMATCSPEEALRLAASHPGDIPLLITDVVMPVMSGRELSRRMSECRPKTKCLFISGYTADIIASQGVLEEGYAFLPKPFTRDALAGKVRELLGA